MANGLEGVFASTLKGIKEMIDVNTVIGAPIETSDNITIIPITKVSLGFGMGGLGHEESIEEQKVAGGSGGGATISPVGFLVVEKGNVKVLNINSESALEKAIDSIPELITSISAFFGNSKD